MSTLTATNTLAHEESILSDNLPLIYEITNRGTSQWVPKRNNNKKAPSINCPKRIDLSVRSRWNAGLRRGFVNIQYVPGAPTCFVNKYVDRDGNIQPGLKDLGYDLNVEYARAVKEGIAFINGVLFLENYGGYNNRVLCEYVFLHSMHEGSPNFAKTRDLNTRMLFRALVAEVKAAKPLEHLEAEVKAANLIGSLRVKIEEGKFVYNTEKMNALLGIHNEGYGLSPEENHQKLNILVSIFRKNPVEFLKEYEDAMAKYEAVIKVGRTLDVLVFGAKEIKMKVGTTSKVLLTFDKENKTSNVEPLVYYFMSAEIGQNDYSVLASEIDRKKLEALK